MTLDVGSQTASGLHLVLLVYLSHQARVSSPHVKLTSSQVSDIALPWYWIEQAILFRIQNCCSHSLETVH